LIIEKCPAAQERLVDQAHNMMQHGDLALRRNLHMRIDASSVASVCLAPIAASAADIAARVAGMRLLNERHEPL
jgi:hypothetical protein